MQNQNITNTVKTNTLNNLSQKKQIILGFLNKKGPSLPSAVSREIGLSLLLTSALLSEMKAEKTIKISNIKIGGSPLYYIRGHESQLEFFIKHLSKKEQEAFELLKKKEVINEEKLEPAHRVAFHDIKDFAIPMNIKFGDKEMTFWRLYTLTIEQASKKISELLKSKKLEKKAEKAGEKERDEKKEIKKKKEKKDKEAFKTKIYSWLKTKSLEIEKTDENIKDMIIASTKSSVGKLNFLVIAKQKARINEADLSLAYQQGQQIKMPVLFLTTGQLTKKAEEYAKSLGKFLIINKI